MTAEFGTVAEWIAEVASRHGPDYAIPGRLPRQRKSRPRLTGCWRAWT